MSRFGLEEEKTVNVVLIATYPVMTQILTELVKGENIHLTNISASFEQAAVEAQKVEKRADIILTRGGTGHFVKQAASIPVISIPIAPFDLAATISELPADIHRVAFVNYGHPIFSGERIERMFGREILQYQFETREQLRACAKAAKADGCQVFIGGSVGMAYAAEEGLQAIEVVSGVDSIYQALEDGIALVRAKRKEKENFTRLKIAFESLSEGICVTDDRGTVRVFNPSASKLLRISSESVVGSDLRRVPALSETATAFMKRQRYLNRLEQNDDLVCSVSHMPIYLENKFIGFVSKYEDVTKIQQLEGQIRQQLHKKGLTAKYRLEDIETQNPAMELQKKLAALYAATGSTVLIEGESGTGKELFAQGIHNASPVSGGPFVSVNCAAIPEALLESELFGYAPGAFTGAKKEGKPGLFELAHNGTIFLDEIGEMPKALQSRLLRVLQEKEIMRLGDDHVIPVNCRIVSATNRDLPRLVADGYFREDLYYRLNIFTVTLPPLRDRVDDIPLLCRSHMARIAPNLNEAEQDSVISDLLERTAGYGWVGNIRELFSMCERLMLLHTLSGRADMPIQDFYRKMMERASRVGQLKGDAIALSIAPDLTLRDAMSVAEEEYISAVLARCHDNQTAAAASLGIGRTTLWRKLTKNEKEEE